MTGPSEYTGPATLTMPAEDGVTTVQALVRLRADVVTGGWHGTLEPNGPIALPYEPVELTLPGRPPAPAYLLEGAGLEIQGERPPPWW